MSAIWPTGIAGDGDLFVAKNNLSTSLNGAVDAVTTTIVLTSAAAFPASGYVTIGTEAIKYTGIAVNTLTGVTRGADGTVATSHLNGTAVNHYAVAAHHNAPKDEIIAVETQLAAEMAATKEPTGFPDASTTTISVVDGTRTFTIAPTGASFDVYVQGMKFTKTSESVTFADTEGVWFFYYNSAGALTSSQTSWSFSNEAPVALLYWDATNNVSLDLADERHGCAMDWATHQYLHSTVGTRFGNGLAASGYVINSAVNADVRFAFDAGSIYDEDLKIDIAAKTEPAQIPVFYRSGAGGLWRRAAATDYPYLTTGTGRIAYNLDTAGTWSQAETTNTNYVAYWIFATDGANYPLISIQGQRQDTSLANAQNNNLYESLAFGTLPYAEMKLLYRVIVQTSNAYGSTMKVRVSEVQDLRSVSNLPAGSYVATDHNSLTGRSTAASHPATAISNTPAGTIAATDVQAAIDELGTEKVAKSGDTMTGALQITIPGSDQGLLLTDGGANYNPQFTMSRNGTSVVKMTGAAAVGTITGGNGLNLGGALDTAQVFIDAAGKVGVGTAPGYTLDVQGPPNDDILNLRATGAGTLGIRMAPTGASGNSAKIIATLNGTDTDLAFRTGGVNNLIVKADGKVGVGATPIVPLQVHLATDRNFGVVNSSGNVKITSFSDTGSLNEPLILDASEYTVQVSGTDKLKIDTSGYIQAPGVYANTDASAANVYVDSSGNLKRSTASGGGSGTVNNGGGTQIAYYPSNGTTVDDVANLSINNGTGDSNLNLYNSESNGTATLTTSTVGTGDARVKFIVDNALTTWTIGADNSDGDSFSISRSATLGTTPALRISGTDNTIATGVAGAAATPALCLNSDTNTGIYAPAADEWAVSAGGTLVLHTKLASGAPRLGVGVAPSYSLDVKQSLSGNDVDFNLENTNASANGVHMFMASAAGYCKKQMKTVGTGDVHINFVSSNSTTKQFTLGIDYSDTKAFVISRSGTLGTSNVLKFVESNGYASMQGVYDQTTASAANVYVNSSGDLMRSTSSLRYKTEIKEVAQDDAAKLLDLTPVTYASLCESDNKEERHYGFIAEELDLIDPTLVNYKTLEDGTKVPDGVQYERVVVGLLKLVQDLTKRVADLEAKQA